MFKSQQYRAKAAEYGELANGSTARTKDVGSKNWRIVSPRSRQELADKYDEVKTSAQDRAHGEALGDEEEHVLRCLGAAVIMQWNTLPKTLQREIFDTAGSVGTLLETASLRGQIARFLHKHKNDADCGRP